MQVSSGKATVKVDASTPAKVEQALAAGRPQARTSSQFERQFGEGALRRHRHAAQGQGRDQQGAESATRTTRRYVVALNLLSRSPHWLTALHALPMYLGLDLRGGVHFLLQVDMQAALTKKAESLAGDLRTMLRDKTSAPCRHHAQRPGGRRALPRPARRWTAARKLLADQFPDLQWADAPRAPTYQADRHAQAARPRDGAGAGAQAEHRHPAQPHQRAGRGRAGDPAAGRRPHRGAAAGRAGHGARPRTSSAARRRWKCGMVDESTEARPRQPGTGPVPFGDERYLERSGRAGGASRSRSSSPATTSPTRSAGFDSQTQEPAVHLTLDAKGARIFQRRDARERRQAHGHPAVREGQGRGASRRR